MYDTALDLLNALRATPDSLTGLLQGHDHAQASIARGGDENWSVVQVLCHLRDAEQFGLERMRKMRDETNPRLASYDQEALAIERNYAATPLSEALAGFIKVRKQHLAELEALKSEDWQRTGQHAEQGEITITSHTLHLVSHDAIHLAQIARQLRSGG